MDGTQSALSSGKYAPPGWISSGAALGRGAAGDGGKGEGEMDGAQLGVEPSATDSPPQLFWKTQNIRPAVSAAVGGVDG